MIALDGSDLMGESSVGWGASISVREGNGDARAVDFSSALSPAACTRDGSSEANAGCALDRMKGEGANQQSN
jgi:hypothetical protein